MARRPSRVSHIGPAYRVATSAAQIGKLRKLSRIAKDRPYTGSIGYSTMQFAAPRAEASGKRSYKDSRGRTRWGKPHIVQRYHARKRAGK